jgi:DNA adenine methylase
VGFHIMQQHHPQEVHLSDINEELINVYSVVQADVYSLIGLLEGYKERHSKDIYYETRGADPISLSAMERAARFIYLNKTCFNGLYRVNSQGKFNVPMGNCKNPAICAEEDLRQISKLLIGVNIYAKSFEWVLEKAQDGDFIYFDPPYHPLDGKSSFTQYTKRPFLEPEQERLAEVFMKLDEKGCKIMLSNSYTDFIMNLYSDYTDTTFTVEANRLINCKAAKRGKVKEIVVTNYEPPRMRFGGNDGSRIG